MSKRKGRKPPPEQGHTSPFIDSLAKLLFGNEREFGFDGPDGPPTFQLGEALKRFGLAFAARVQQYAERAAEERGRELCARCGHPQSMHWGLNNCCQVEGCNCNPFIPRARSKEKENGNV